MHIHWRLPGQLPGTSSGEETTFYRASSAGQKNRAAKAPAGPRVPLMPGRERSPSEARAETLSGTSPTQNGVTCHDFLASYVPDGSTFLLQGQACRAKPGRWEVRKLTGCGGARLAGRIF